MIPLYITLLVLPLASAAVTGPDSGNSLLDYWTTLFDFLSNLDSEMFLAIATLLVTLSVVSAAIYYENRYQNQETEKLLSRLSSDTLGESSEKQDTPDENSLTQDQNDSPQEEAKEENHLVLIQCPRGRKTPCIAPFPLKLETFLRVHKIKYELDFNNDEPKLLGSPWIKFNSEEITESQNVVQFLINKFEIQSDKQLSAEEFAIANAYTHLLEHHLYWGIALWRWVYDGARSLREIQFLPKKIQETIPDVCKTIAQAAWFHGIGKMTPGDVKKAVMKDLVSLSEFLGDKDHFLGTEVPTELDCTAFGMLAQFLWNMKGPFHDAIVNNHQNLREFCWRMRSTYWPDWEDCLNNKDFTTEPYPVAENINYCM